MAYFQTDNLWVNRLGDGVADLVMDLADNQVNELSSAVLADIALALDRVVAHGHYMVPAWTARDTRIAWNTWVLEHPAFIPPYPPEGVPYMDWPITAFWTPICTTAGPVRLTTAITARE